MGRKPHWAFLESPEDIYGRLWPDVPNEERCPECGQPDNCGDCDHTPLEPKQVIQLGGVLVGKGEL